MRIAGPTLLLVALAVAAAPAAAGSDLGFKGAGGRLSYVDADVGHTLGFGAHLELGEVTRAWALQFLLSYWKTTDNDDGNATGLTTDLLTVEADLRYMFDNESPRFRPYAGGGLGVHFGGTEGGGTAPVSETRLGLTVVAGTYYAVDSGVELLGEFRYVFADIFDHWSLSAGVTFLFGS